MTPKEKAQELVNKMLNFTDWHEEDAKQCALIAVDEIIKLKPFNSKFDDSYNITLHYWYEVKNQLEHL